MVGASTHVRAPSALAVKDASPHRCSLRGATLAPFSLIETVTVVVKISTVHFQAAVFLNSSPKEGFM